MAYYGISGELDLKRAPINVCCIQFSRTDRIRLMGQPLPAVLIDPLRVAILESWGRGIQDTRYVDESHSVYEFKLCGNPWVGNGDESVGSRSVLAELLRVMAQYGWNLVVSFDPSKKSNDKDTLFFEYGQADPETQTFAVSFNMTDRIRLISAPMPSLNQQFEEFVVQGWPKGIQGCKDYCGSLEVKLRGNPWWTSNREESIATKLFLCGLIAKFRNLGYKLYASVDITAKGDREGRDLDSWVFRKVTNVWAG